MNKEIQIIPDSKKFTISGDNIELEGENVSINLTDESKEGHLNIKCTLDHEKVEQNQKIVTELINEYTQLGNVADSFTKKINNNETALHNQELARQKRDRMLLKRDHLSKIIKKATGKDIKELSS